MRFMRISWIINFQELYLYLAPSLYELTLTLSGDTTIEESMITKHFPLQCAITYFQVQII